MILNMINKCKDLNYIMAIDKTISNINNNNITSIASYVFLSCSKLTTVNCLNCNYIGEYAFAYCHALTTASFPNCTYIGEWAFLSCTSLTSSLVSISNARAFYNTPISNQTYTGSFGSIYVPFTLLEQYQNDSIWQTYKDRLSGININ